jgi:hypothetical protein
VSQFGLNPFGTEAGAFGGPGLITILGTLPVASNELIMVFDRAPLADDPEGFDSATNVKNWVFAPVDPTIPSTAVPGLVFVPKGEVVPTRTQLIAAAFVDDDDPTQIHLTTDSEMEQAVRYEITAQPAIRGLDCEELVGELELELRALEPGPARVSRFVQEDRFRDWANEFFPADPKQGEATWKLEDSGDIAIHDAEKSLRKRIMRRLLGNRAAFAHLPNYGASRGIKALVRSGDVQALANAAQEQVAQEPDVLQAAATATISNTPSGDVVVALEIFVQRSDARDSRFLFEFPLA